MSSVRLNKKLQQQIDAIARQKNQTRSSVIREALKEYVAKHDTDTNPYEIGKDKFGARGSGETDRSATYRARVKSKLYEKHNH